MLLVLLAAAHSSVSTFWLLLLVLAVSVVSNILLGVTQYNNFNFLAAVHVCVFRVPVLPKPIVS